MENTEIPPLSTQLLALQAEHRMLDLEIGRLQEFPYIDQLQLQRQKRKKLRLKQNIELIKDMLIPDLDAWANNRKYWLVACRRALAGTKQ